MKIEKAIENIKEQIYTENGKHFNYIDICNTFDDECENFICAIETVINSYLKEKARADKIEKDYSKALTKIDELEANEEAE